MKVIDVAKELEELIAIFFNGYNYKVDGIELSREDSRLVAYSLIHTYQMTERIVLRKKQLSRKIR